MAYFYENDRDRTPNWEDLGGFNAHLLMEMRGALLDVDQSRKPAPNVQDFVAEWIRKHPAFEFPDDEVG